jgi:hypothetical protein
MKKFSEKYADFMYESLEDKYKDKISGEYESLKRGILLLLDNSVENSDELINVQNFINQYIEDDENATMVGLVDDAEIFEFWNKYKEQIDEICSDKKYFDKSPTENNIFSVYAFMINATKFAVKETLKSLENDLFSEGKETQGTQSQPQETTQGQ